MLKKPSATMQAACLIRADKETILGEDEIAREIVEKLPEAARCREQLDQLSRGMFSRSVIIRSCFFREILGSSYEYEQLVLMSAGLDFSFRKSVNWHNKPVFMVDHPLSSAMLESFVDFNKSEFINVKRVPINFEGMDKEQFTQALLDKGFDGNQSTLFVWEGATFYLPKNVILNCLKYIGEICDKNKIAADFANEESWCNKKDSHEKNSNQLDNGAKQSLQLLESINEPWQSFFSPKEIENRLRQLGYSKLNICFDSDLEARYLKRSLMHHKSMFYLMGEK